MAFLSVSSPEGILASQEGEGNGETVPRGNNVSKNCSFSFWRFRIRIPSSMAGTIDERPPPLEVIEKR
jgi:hypothetical protein